jgi:hypothetical protein
MAITTPIIGASGWGTTLNTALNSLDTRTTTLEGFAKPLYNGSFEDLTTQTSAGTTSANVVTVGTTTHSNGVSVVSGSRITYANAGNYYVNFLGQFKFSGGASNYDVTVWYAKNGTNVANSAYTYTLTSAQGSQTIANLTDIVTVAAGDYIQFYWYTSVTPSAGPNGIYLFSAAAGASPTRPASPSVNINTFNIG